MSCKIQLFSILTWRVGVLGSLRRDESIVKTHKLTKLAIIVHKTVSKKV